MASTQKAKIPVGFVIAGKYRVTGELGRGGMAAVYEAENVDIGKRVAIKVLAQELISSTIVVERFLREARAVAAIRSPYICDVYDSGRLEDGRPFLVLELLEGESLYERMVRVGPIDVETTVMTMAQTCRGLTRAHAAGIVHRDLKPENIFVTKDEEGELLCKILDFGLAKFYQPVEDGAAQARLTREGAVFGTPAYMSPEQVRGQGAVDARADLWALGCIAYECLTGRTVWATDQGVAMTFAQIAQGHLPDPLQHRPDLPDTFKEWFEKALHKNIEERFQTPKEFAEELMIAMNFAPRGAGEHSQDLTFQLRGLESSLMSPHRSSPHGERSMTRPSLATGRGASSAALRSSPQSGPTPIAHETSPNQAPAPNVRQETLDTREAVGKGGNKLLLTVGVLAVLGAGGYFGYRSMFPPGGANDAVDSADAGPTAVVPVSGTPTSVTSAAPLLHDVGPKWRPLLSEAQVLIAKGDLDGARDKIREAVDQGAHHTPATFLQHLETVKAGNKGEPLCKMTGLGRPRTYDLLDEKARRVPSSKPSIAVGTQGAVVVWTQNTDGAEQVQAVSLDEYLRAKTKPFDVTPEAQSVARAEIVPMGDKFLLTYWDTKGPEGGAYARYLGPDGRIESPAALIAKAPGYANSPTVVMAPDGALLFIWQEPTDKNTEDLYARRFDRESLKPLGEKVRLSAFTPRVGGRTKPRNPVAGVDGDSLRLTYRFEKDPDRAAVHLRVPFTAIAEGGVNANNMTTRTPDRFLGMAEVISKPRMRADAVGMACAPEICFAVWHEEGQDGIFAAPFIKGSQAPLYKDEVVKNLGRNPGIGVSSSGKMQLFWYESKGRVVTASIKRDELGQPSTVARVAAVDRPWPAVSAGLKDGEWYSAWSDYEGGQAEVYVVRVECK